MVLPEDFISLMRQHLGEEQAENLFRGLDEPPTVAVRFNQLKTSHLTLKREQLGDPVPWCPDAYYLTERKAFTFDPLFHAGAYYVQDASSMYLASILARWLGVKGEGLRVKGEGLRVKGEGLRIKGEGLGVKDEGLRGNENSSPFTLNPSPFYALDLCAAPGGKSTLLASCLPDGSTLISNEPIRKRAQVLAENMQKWGYPNCYVTSNYPCDFAHFRSCFDFILADVPCSGEGMFRKDAVAVSEWSLENVRYCVERQREILQDILPTLRPGGMLVYSTCTFNRFEDEEQVQWLVSEYGLQLLEERHFFPGRDRGEGLYMAALLLPNEDNENVEHREKDVLRKLRTLNVMASVNDYNNQWLTIDGKLELSYSDAIHYLRHEALHIPVPRGILTVTYCDLPLGLVKSIGTRLNNLYPQEWRIRTTYNPTEPLPDFFLSNKR